MDVLLNKEDVQKRILHYGEQLPLDKFVWDFKSQTFLSSEQNLIIDFTDLNNKTFHTASRCFIKAGDRCNFTTNCFSTIEFGNSCNGIAHGYFCTIISSHDCIFHSGSYCTFRTGGNCTFITSLDCIVMRGAEGGYEIIKLKENKKTTLLSNFTKGYDQEDYTDELDPKIVALLEIRDNLIKKYNIKP